jgi:hypothetical protein
VLSPIDDGARREIGDTIVVAEAEGQALVSAGAAEPILPETEAG